MERKKVIIIGAAGRDFHNFNTAYRDNERYEVVAFTATQIPKIEDRVYPAVLAGKLYPDGIPIVAEEDQLPVVRTVYDVRGRTSLVEDKRVEYVHRGPLLRKRTVCRAAAPSFRSLLFVHQLRRQEL